MGTSIELEVGDVSVSTVNLSSRLFCATATDLFASRDPEKSKALMTVLDSINARHGRETVRLGGLAKRSGGWAMKRGDLSPAYTTRLEDIFRIGAL